MGVMNDMNDTFSEQQKNDDDRQNQTSVDRQGYSDYTEYEPEEIDI